MIDFPLMLLAAGLFLASVAVLADGHDLFGLVLLVCGAAATVLSFARGAV